MFLINIFINILFYLASSASLLARENMALIIILSKISQSVIYKQWILASVKIVYLPNISYEAILEIRKIIYPLNEKNTVDNNLGNVIILEFNEQIYLISPDMDAIEKKVVLKIKALAKIASNFYPSQVLRQDNGA